MGLGRWRGIAIALALACGPAAASVAEEAWQPLGPWRLVEGRAAPWRGARAPATVDPGMRGATLRFAAGRVEAPAPLGCEGAAYEVVLQPAAGLFQGSLPAPAEAAATTLGFASFPVATLRVACSSGAFDYHFRDDATLLVALDAVVWRLERRDTESEPADAVTQRLLLGHTTHDMGFTEAGFARKAPLLAPALAELGHRALAAQARTDEAPVVNGDPFTNSQEYPDRFSLGATREHDGRAIVPVRFADAHRGWRIDYQLERQAGAWRITDLRYEDGSTLRALFQAAIDEGAR